MTDFPWLTTLAAVPLVGAVVVVALPPGATAWPSRSLSAFSLVTLAMTIAMALAVRRQQPELFQFTELHEWIPQFGVSYALGVDGIALVLIAWRPC